MVAGGWLGVGRETAGQIGGGIHTGPWEGSKPAVDPNPGLAAEIEDGGKTFPEEEFTWFAKGPDSQKQGNDAPVIFVSCTKTIFTHDFAFDFHCNPFWEAEEFHG